MDGHRKSCHAPGSCDCRTRGRPVTPIPDPGTWIGTAGAGLALTSGNSDTLNFNVAFDITRDPKTRNIMKWTGLYLRGEQNDALVANRLSLSFRDQYALTARAYTFGQLDYLRDTFKLIDYLVAPTAGVGYKVIDTATTKFSTDAGLGVVWEKNPDLDVRTSMALLAGEKLEHALTSTSALKHAATGYGRPTTWPTDCIRCPLAWVRASRNSFSCRWMSSTRSRIVRQRRRPRKTTWLL